MGAKNTAHSQNNSGDGERPDLLIAGAGGGLAGALRAAQLGLRVLVVEASSHFAHGNNTSMSTAMIPGAGSSFQREVGVEDSPERFVADIMAKTKGTAGPVAAQALAEVSAALVEWLSSWVGLPLSLATDFPYPGHSTYRCHTLPGRSGARLLDGLLKKAEELDNLDILVPARLVEVRQEAGHMVGTIAYPDGSTEDIPTRAVLLATNGFGANRDLVARYLPEIRDAVYHGSAESRGDAIAIGERLGASTAYLDAYQGHGALTTPYATLLGWATVMHGAILVNSQGTRFGDETRGYSEYAAEVLAQDGGSAVVVLDRHIYDACQLFDDFKQSEAAGALRWGETPEELAAAFDCDAVGLRASIEEAVRLAKEGGSDGFGRTHWPHALDAPFVGARVTGALFHTQGGLRIDRHGRVLRADDSVIEGLYAAGGAAEGISGHGASGYLAGNGLLPALGLSFLAAEHVASMLNGEGS